MRYCPPSTTIAWPVINAAFAVIPSFATSFAKPLMKPIIPIFARHQHFLEFRTSGSAIQVNRCRDPARDYYPALAVCLCNAGRAVPKLLARHDRRAARGLRPTFPQWALVPRVARAKRPHLLLL